MDKLRRSPFKVARIETDPNAFGRRVEDVRACAEALFNYRNVLISGPRGIGKSSLGSQLQIAYSGDNTLLERCGISSSLPKYLCAFYAVDSNTSLAELCSEILYSLERGYAALKSFTASDVKVSFEIDLKFIKGKLESAVATRRPATLATELVAGLSAISRALKHIGAQGINVMLDEVDLIPREINFGHFMKIVHETLGREQLHDVTFILAGQRGIYTRLTSEDASTERLIRHVPLTTLEPDEAEHVLEYAALTADPPFVIANAATEMLLALSAGYPYDIHLLGDAAFSVMDNSERMSTVDVLRGLHDLFRSDKREKYLERLKSLSEDQRLVVVSLSRHVGSQIPMQISLIWLQRNLIGRLSPGTYLEHVIDALVREGHLIVNASEGFCQFTEELFRIFVSLLVLDQETIEQQRLDRALRKELSERRYYQDLAYDSIDDARMKATLEAISRATFEAAWAREDYSHLLRSP